MEQRDHTPQEPGDDIGRAAAEAAARAGEYEAGPDYGDAGAPAGSRPRRWLIVGGVAVAALAAAGGAAAFAGRSHSSHDTTQNAAASSTPGPTPGATSPSTAPTTDGSTPVGTTASGTSTAPPTSDAKTPTTAPKTSPTSPSQPTSPSKTATTTPPPADGENGDCENTSHDTAADESAKFSGMTRGTQQAFLAAQKVAQGAGLSFVLNSGYRSAAYQQRIFDCWVKQLGSPQAARQYALPPNESAHVQGYAMDIAPPSAASWLESTAGKYGLCRRYEDETWHFEYQARYKTQGCPALLPHP